MGKIKAFIQFTNERFDPATHIIMIALFVLFHLAMGGAIGLFGNPKSLWGLIFCLSFFFKLRLYDELKDYKTDLINNPMRPLPRGLLTLKDVRLAIVATFALEFLLTINETGYTKIFTLIAWFYSLLMYKEFFLSKFLEDKLTTYALTHTFVVFFLSLRTFSVFTDTPLNFWQSSLSCYFCFNVFEFGRKTFTLTEEKKVQTYSNIFGKTGAFFLTFSQIIAAIYLIILAHNNGISPRLLGVTLFSFLLMLPYLLTDKYWAGKLFRSISSVFIILFFITNITLTF